MKQGSSIVRLAAVAITIGFLSTSANAADGKPFLMKIGTGEFSGTVAIPNDTNFHSSASVTVEPKKSGFCAVTASSNLVTSGGAGTVTVTIGTAADSPGPWQQFHDFTNSSYSVAITQAFVVTKDVPVTFYLNVANSKAASISSETTRIWAICASQKDPVLP